MRISIKINKTTHNQIKITYKSPVHAMWKNSDKYTIVINLLRNILIRRNKKQKFLRKINAGSFKSKLPGLIFVLFDPIYPFINHSHILSFSQHSPRMLTYCHSNHPYFRIHICLKF